MGVLHIGLAVTRLQVRWVRRNYQEDFVVFALLEVDVRHHYCLNGGGTKRVGGGGISVFGAFRDDRRQNYI